MTDPITQVTTEVVGETLSTADRLVVSPCEGRFLLAPSQHYTAEGEYVLEGQIVGHVVNTQGVIVAVESQFSGWVMRFLVADGTPVRDREPVLHLRRL